MNNKSEMLYRNVLKFIDRKFNIEPHRVMCDYEKALRNAVKFTWNQSSLLGCWFHYCQCLRRKFQSINGMYSLVSTNSKAKKIFQMFLKLPLLPKQSIEKGFDFIIQYQHQHKLSEKFLTFNAYFKTIWLNRYSKSFSVFYDRNRTNYYV